MNIVKISLLHTYTIGDSFVVNCVQRHGQYAFQCPTSDSLRLDFGDNFTFAIHTPAHRSDKVYCNKFCLKNYH